MGTPPMPPAADASNAGITPPSAEPAQQTCPEAQSAGAMHSFEAPLQVPVGTQAAEGGIANIVQHVWPDGHLLAVPPPPPESAPQVAMMPRGFVPPPSASGLIVVLPGPPVVVPLSGEAPEEEELHAEASPRPRKAR